MDCEEYSYIEGTHLITTWRLRNFKSIRSAELEMGPLTIFAGANSSGKSTLIQSILLMSQTSASKVHSRTVVLNGHLTKLGQFDDLLSANSGESRIFVGWECQPRLGRARAPFGGTESASVGGSLNQRTGARIESISYGVSLDVESSGPRRELMQLQPRLLSCTLSCTARARRGETRSTVSATRVGVTTREKMKHLEVSGRNNIAVSSSLDYDVALDADSMEELREELTSGEPVGCFFRHFLPESLSVRYDEAEVEARLVASAICELRPRFPTHVTRRLYTRDIIIPGPVIGLLKERLGNSARPMLAPQARQQDVLSDDPAFEHSSDRITLRDWYNRARSLTPRARAEMENKIRMDSSLAEDISDAVKRERSSRYALQPYRPEELTNAVSYLDGFFSNSVRYIGPLRDEPKPVYPLAAAEDPSNVGLRGEYTAAVLDLHKDSRVRYMPAANFTQASVDTRASSAPLKAAVLDWLRYMGVAEEVQTRDMGKLGHELQVVSPGLKTPHDLTHVGVGVSQVLPVVVACLLAEEDTTLIFEQPELHLHPRVQTLLADFFLSVALLGKQCLVETHSEYLINRLRFRVASAPTDNLSSMIKTYFVEKRDDASHFREVSINRYGAIVDWPEGFFDQSQKEAESILRAAVTKRKQERGRSEDA